jgi:hypothetical protein
MVSQSKISYMPMRQQRVIDCNETGLAVITSDRTQTNASLEWGEVDAVLAYKRDLYALDLICLGFVTSNGTIEVNEEMEGWSLLVEQLPSLLPGIPPLMGWWERVAKPPFAPSVTTLYKRE